MDKKLLFVGAISGTLVVLIGAFGSHFFKDQLLVNNKIETFRIGINYHMFHTLAILVIGSLTIKKRRLIGVLFIVGTILFSGSLYILSLTNISQIGIITPFGGVAFVIGWIMTAFLCLKK